MTDEPRIVAEVDVGKIRELIELVLKDADLKRDTDELTISLVLTVLSTHFLLRGFTGTPADFHARVQSGYSESLRLLFRGETSG